MNERSEGLRAQTQGAWLASCPGPAHWGWQLSGPLCLLCLHCPPCLSQPRTSHSRAKAEAALTAAQKAQEEARIARITAKEFSPSFQHRENGEPGRDAGAAQLGVHGHRASRSLPLVTERVCAGSLGTCPPRTRDGACMASASLPPL